MLLTLKETVQIGHKGQMKNMRYRMLLTLTDIVPAVHKRLKKLEQPQMQHGLKEIEQPVPYGGHKGLLPDLVKCQAPQISKVDILNPPEEELGNLEEENFNLDCKTRRLKQAKEEAQAEIEQYRTEREREFQQKQQAAMGSQGNLSSEVEQQTKKKIQTMQTNYQRNREKMLRQLLTLVCEIKPEIHNNYKIGA
ncbi:VATG2 ATPase, partial [Polypterus senegalus]